MFVNARRWHGFAKVNDTFRSISDCFTFALDIFLVLLATVLIIGITVLYLRSITIALIIVVAAALSLGVSYFIYRVIYGIPIFPFMNLMSAFILIGIGCDDIFVFFDTWEQEKAEWIRKYREKLHMDSKKSSLAAD